MVSRAFVPLLASFLIVGTIHPMLAAPVSLQAEAGERTPHGHMKPSIEVLRRWEQKRALALASPATRLWASSKAQVAASSVDLLSSVSTVGSERDQGSNGDCWVWASSAMAEVAMKGQYSIRDRLSIQFVDSMMSSSNWKNGGTLYDYCEYTSTAGLLVPWSNVNAEYVDGLVNSYCTEALMPLASISTVPAYGHPVLIYSTIPTFGVGQSTAIANIKSYLDQGKAVGFSFTTDFSSSKGFSVWWEGNAETTLWPEPRNGPTSSYDASTWGAHMVVIVGYDASDANASNHYWKVLNSWGTTTDRPNGLFYLPMLMNYDSTSPDGGYEYQNYWFEALGLSADHATTTAPTVAIEASNPDPKAAESLQLTASVTGDAPMTYQWRCDGTVISGADAAVYTIPYLTSDWEGQQIDVVVSNAAGTVVSSPITISVNGDQLLSDSGFESGDNGAWTWTSTLSGSYASPFREYAINAHSGSYYLFLGNLAVNNAVLPASGTLDRTVAIPSAVSSATISYWVRCGTSQTTDADLDTLTVQLRTTDGALIRTLKTHTNRQTDCLLWSRQAFDVTDLAGQTIQLHLAWADTTSTQTFWRLDDFALTTTTFSTVTRVSRFSPTSGSPGTLVTITGSCFSGATAVQIGGAEAVFKAVSDSQIQAIVPASSQSGVITVTTPKGTDSSSAFFTKSARSTVDLDGNGEVNVADMATLASVWGGVFGSSATTYLAISDLNGDGSVDEEDLLLFWTGL